MCKSLKNRALKKICTIPGCFAVNGYFLYKAAEAL